MAANRWSIPIDALAKRVGLDIETVARKATFELFTKVNLRSPVDTGRFRANWNVSYQTADTSTTASAEQGRAAGEIAKTLTMPVGGVAWMSNGTSYGPFLEFGSSKQAPAGFIRVSVAEFADYVRKVAA